MFNRGINVMSRFALLNDILPPAVREFAPHEWQFSVCAYWRDDTVAICLAKCAAIGTAGRQWSYPGYSVDRTPYGVLQHELGHHVDVTKSNRKCSYYGDFSVALRGQSGEKELTSYCPNDAEWFAEMFRLYVTNPDLLRLLRPRTHRELASQFKPVFEDTWRDRMQNAPARTIAVVERKIGEQLK
jgi:hypothetical protein